MPDFKFMQHVQGVHNARSVHCHISGGPKLDPGGQYEHGVNLYASLCDHDIRNIKGLQK